MEIAQNNTNKFIRQTAYKAWIGDLLSGVFIKGRGDFEASYIAARGLNISRVNLIGVVISSDAKEGFSSAVVDDGSGAIALRAWKEDVSRLAGVEIGNLVLVVGKVRSFNGSTYVIPDFVRKLDNTEWMKFRKFELEKKFGKFIKMEAPVNAPPIVDSYVPGADLEEQDMSFVATQEENVSNDSNSNAAANSGDIGSKRAAIVSLIESEDKGEGADIAVVISKSGLNDNDAQTIIDELIKGGEIFEIRAGFVRTLV